MITRIRYAHDVTDLDQGTRPRAALDGGASETGGMNETGVPLSQEPGRNIFMIAEDSGASSARIFRDHGTHSSAVASTGTGEAGRTIEAEVIAPAPRWPAHRDAD